jgi:hypothetical protein
MNDILKRLLRRNPSFDRVTLGEFPFDHRVDVVGKSLEHMVSLAVASSSKTVIFMRNFRTAAQVVIAQSKAERKLPSDSDQGDQSNGNNPSHAPILYIPH